MTTNEDDIFAQAANEHEQEKQEQEERKNYNYEDLERPEWVGMEVDKPLVVRLLGMPINKRTENWHPKIVYQSDILTDNGKSLIKVNWHQSLDADDRETGQLDSDWILKKLFDDITQKDWEDNPDGEINPKTGKIRKIPVYHNADMQVFKRVIEKNMRSNDKFPRRFDPFIRAVLPVIDRTDDWCKKNKHSKLLTSSKNYWKDDKQGNPIYFTDLGVPFVDVYEFILINLAKHLKDWKNYDVIFTRRKVQNGKKINYKYHITHGGDAAMPSEAREFVITDGLTEEELQYEHFNLDKIYSPCSYQKLQKHLLKLFKDWDAYAGSIYTQELEELVKIEKEEFSAKKAEEEKTQHPVSKPDNSVDASSENETSVQEEQPVRKRRISENETEAFSLDDQCAKHFPKWNDIPEEDKKAIIESIESFKGNEPIWKNDVRFFPCENKQCKYSGTETRTEVPETSLSCPVCGITFEAA